MSLRDIKPEPREIPIGQIIPPELPARSQMDEHKLDELAENIARNGIIQRLIVAPSGDRYEVIAGHRRSIAAQRAGLVVVPCDVYPTKDAALEAVKYAENRFREDMSPAEESIYFNELLERDCGGDIEKLAALVGEKLSYVDARVRLVRGDAEVFQALLERKISIGVAQALNELPAEDYRRYYLELAKRDGATVAVVRAWVTDWKRSYQNSPQAPTPATSSGPIVPVAAYDPHRCHICRKSDPRFIPQTISVHQHFLYAILEPMLAAYHGEGAAAPSSDYQKLGPLDPRD